MFTKKAVNIDNSGLDILDSGCKEINLETVFYPGCHKLKIK